MTVLSRNPQHSIVSTECSMTEVIYSYQGRHDADLYATHGKSKHKYCHIIIMLPPRDEYLCIVGFTMHFFHV